MKKSISQGKKCVHSMCGSVPLKSAGLTHVEEYVNFDGGSFGAMLTCSDITFTVCQTPRLGIISGQSTVLGRIKLFCRNE